MLGGRGATGWAIVQREGLLLARIAVPLGVAITTTANPCKGWPDLVAETTTVHQRPVAQRMSIFRGDIHELKPTDHATSHMPVVMIAM